MRLLFHWHRRMPLAVTLLAASAAGLFVADIIAKVAGFSLPPVTTALNRAIMVELVPPLDPIVFPEALPCRENPFKGLEEKRSKFELLSPCRAAAGRVLQVFGNPDGEIHVHIWPDENSRDLLNDINRRKLLGLLITEVTPYDQKRGVKIPHVGQRVEVVGAWVTDKPHGWNELHPVWEIRVLDK